MKGQIEEVVHGANVSELARVVTQALMHNPIHLAIFGAVDARAEHMQYKMFSSVLRLPDCNLFAVKEDNQIVGVMNYYKQGCCQLGPIKTLSLLPGLATTLGGKLPRVLKWKSNWASHDPKHPHLHFGPLAVAPSRQGHGIGSAMLTHFCAIADQLSLPAHLETDKKGNVPLYERFGFKVKEEDQLFGVRNWFMWRDAVLITNSHE